MCQRGFRLGEGGDFQAEFFQQATYSNLNKGTSYVQRSFNLSAYKGQTIRVYFLGVEGTQVATSFLIDDVSLMTQ